MAHNASDLMHADQGRKREGENSELFRQALFAYFERVVRGMAQQPRAAVSAHRVMDTYEVLRVITLQRCEF